MDVDLSRPWGARLRTWRETQMNWTREELAEEVNAAGFKTNEQEEIKADASLVRNWENGRTKRAHAKYRRMLAFLGAPLPSSPAQSRPRSELVLPPKHPGANGNSSDDGSVQRRDFFKAAGGTSAALAGIPLWDRLSNTLNTNKLPDQEAANGISARTLDLFDSEERQSSDDLAQRVQTHLESTVELLGRANCEDIRKHLAAQAGATAALYGWLAYDLRDLHTAERYYGSAGQAARDAEDPQLAACVLTYRSYVAQSRGAPREGERLLDSANEVLGKSYWPMKSWIAARQAETYLSMNDANRSLQAFQRAYDMQDIADGSARPMWTRFFTPERLDGMAAAGYARLNHPELGSIAQRLHDTIGPAETKVQQIALADLAYAYLERGDVEHGAEYGQRAIDAFTTHAGRVGHDRLLVIQQALAPYRTARAGRDLNDRLTSMLRAA